MQTNRNRKIDSVQTELKLVKRLIQLSRVCWSPTLRANLEFLESLRRELQAESASRQKIK